MQNLQSDGQTATRYDDLLALYSDEIYRLCHSLTYCTADAEDLFQDTFLTVLERRHSEKSIPDARRLLYATAVFTWKSAKRKYARRRRIAPTGPLTDAICAPQSLESDVETSEALALVRTLVAALPEKYRIPVTLFYACELPVREIAAALHLAEGTVKSRLFKARSLLEKGLVNRL